MCHDIVGDDNFFQHLREHDLQTARLIQSAGCPFCEGRLHRADYPRKPRGAELAAAGEGIDRRISLCCGREGCRRRSTPPSLVFLGRRVYLALAVLVVSMRWMLGFRSPRAVPPRTIRRWLDWFRVELAASCVFAVARGWLRSPVPAAELPASLVAGFEATGRSAGDVATATLAFLAPLGASPHLLHAAISRGR